MEWLTVSNLINMLFVVLGWSIKNELRHIRESFKESINNVKEVAIEAKNIATKAHERIDRL